MFEHQLESPVGTLRVRATEDALTGVYFQRHKGAPPPSARSGADLPVVREACAQLRSYFGGELRAFDLPLAADGSALELDVWAALRTIGYGETRTYGALADQLQRAGAARAIGGANARNPLSIVVPCHRVIGADGKLTGYAGGVEAKAWLLAHERALARR